MICRLVSWLVDLFDRWSGGDWFRRGPLLALLLLAGCATMPPETHLREGRSIRPPRSLTSAGAEMFTTTLRWTNPGHDAGEGCAAGPDSLTDLDHVSVYLDADCPDWPAPCPWCVPVFVCRVDARGLAGRPMAVPVAFPTAGRAFMVAVDDDGNPSRACGWVRVP